MWTLPIRTNLCKLIHIFAPTNKIIAQDQSLILWPLFLHFRCGCRLSALFCFLLKVFDHDWFATPFIMMTCQVGAPSLLQQTHAIIRKLVLLMFQTGTPFNVFSVCITISGQKSSSVEASLDKMENPFFIILTQSFLIAATTTECFDCTTTSKQEL